VRKSVEAWQEHFEQLLIISDVDEAGPEEVLLRLENRQEHGIQIDLVNEICDARITENDH
jgi:hypothetical protein